MVPRNSTWVLERCLGFGSISISRPSQLIHASRLPTKQYRYIFASKGLSKQLSTVSTSAVSHQRRWPWYLVTFASGFGSAVIYKLLTEPVSDSPLNPQTFAPYTLVSREQVSSTGSIFTLRPSRSSALTDRAETYQYAWKNGIWSVEVRQPQLQIARAYTPLPPSQLVAKSAEDDGTGLRFFIRRDPKGEVSGYLHKLPEGATIDLRGPHLEYKIPNDVGEVLFLAGGTGIAPALQAAHTLLSHRPSSATGSPKIRIFWANRRREDCMGGLSHQAAAASGVSNNPGLWSGLAQPQVLQLQRENLDADGRPQAPLVKELIALQKQHPSRFSVDYFVDEESTYINEARLKQCVGSETRWGSQSAKTHAVPAESGTGRKLILISGPDGFVEYLAGPKVWENGKEGQGSLGGVLGRLDPRGWEVWKL
ncbi:MAG: hypothetical protein LQ347_005015 [Umbilicaria vellea]|nr:MAG: hypothetical protein LQ347_005015 [Umbilicaria vellea]